MNKKTVLGIALAVALVVPAYGAIEAAGRSHDRGEVRSIIVPSSEAPKPTAADPVRRAEAMLEQVQALEGVEAMILLKRIVGLELPAQPRAENVQAEALRMFNEALTENRSAGPREFGQVATASGPSTLTDSGADDTCDGAIPINLDHSETGYINPAYDVDWREFTLTERTRVLMETRKESPQLEDDTVLTLYGGCDAGTPIDEVAFNDDGGEFPLSLLDVCLRPGTYYLEVAGWQETTPVNFELAAELVESPCLEVDDPANANLLFTPEEDHAIPGPPQILQQESVYSVSLGDGIFDHIPGLVPFTSGVDALHEPDLFDELPAFFDECNPCVCDEGGTCVCEICLCPIDDPECECEPICEPERPPLLFSVNPSVFVVNDGVLKHLFEGEVYRVDGDGVIEPDAGWAALGISNATLNALAMDWDGNYYFSTDKRERIVYNGKRKTLFPGSVYYRVPNGGGKIRRYFNGADLGIGNIDAFHLFPSGDIAFSTAAVEYYAGPTGVETLFPEHIYVCDPEDCVPQIYLDATEWGNENLNGFTLGSFGEIRTGGPR